MTTCRSRSRRPTFDRDDNRERASLVMRGTGGGSDEGGERGAEKRNRRERIAARYRQTAKATVSTGVIPLVGENDA